MTDDRNQPDPSEDTWSAWLPQLDRTADPARTVDEPADAPPAPPPPRPAPHARPSRPQPVMPELPHLPPPPRLNATSWGYLAPPRGTTYQARPGTAPNRPPKNHLLAAVITTFMFWPFGVIALVKAASVNHRWARGDVDGAYRASRAARSWALAAAITALCFLMLVNVFIGLVLMFVT